METNLFEGVFKPNLLKKRLKMTKSSDTCQGFRITVEALKISGIIVLRTFQKSNLYRV